MADSCEWIFRLSGRHHCKSRIYERMENFQNDCCPPWTKTLFKNSCSRQLRIVNAVVSWSPAGQIHWPKSVFSKIKLFFLRRWWQLWMKSTGIKQRYRINFFLSVMFRLSVLLLNSMSKLIQNRWTCKLIIKTLHTCMQTNNCFNPLFSVVQLWNYTKTIIPLRLSEYCRIIPSTSSRGLFDISKFSAPTIAFLAFWLAKKLRLSANSPNFTSYGK